MKTNTQLNLLLIIIFIGFISCKFECSASRDAIEGLKPKKVWVWKI